MTQALSQKLYTTDFVLWAEDTVARLKVGDYSQVDWENLIDEVAALASKEDVRELKGSQKAQIWTLIGILGTAVVGTVIRFVIPAMPA